MSRSLWTIAELVWRQINPPGSDEAKNTLEEYVERAKDEYANAAFNMWVQLRNDSDLSMLEHLLQRKKYEVKSGAEGLYADLDISVMELPKDVGIVKVQPPKQQPLTRTTLSTMDLFKDDPGERTFYRIGSRVYFPDGFALGDTKEVMVSVLTTDFVEDELEIPEILAKPVEDALLKAYGTTANIRQDISNDQKADQ